MHTKREEQKAAEASDLERHHGREENSRDAEAVPDNGLPLSDVIGSSGMIPPAEIVRGLARRDQLGSPGAEADQQQLPDRSPPVKGT